LDTLVFPYQQVAFDKWLSGAAAFLGQQAVNNTLTVPPQVGLGYVKALTIQPGLSFALGNFHFNIDTRLQVMDNDKNGYLLYFRKLEISDKYVFNLGGDKKVSSEENFEAAFLLSSRTSHTLEFKKGTHVMSLVIYMEEEWVNENLDTGSRKKIEQYVAGGLSNYNKEVLPAKHKKILETMLREDLHLPLSNLFLQTRAFRMMEHFLNAVLTRSENEMTAYISEEDMKKIMMVEKSLISTGFREFPSIEESARMALMSETKLKKLFKQVFKMGLYEYYQKNRMHQARQMLHSGKHKISEIGTLLGYSNLSSFSTAFRKEFGFLPSEFKNISQDMGV
jgi:AraC-like DNA-binding protein